MTQSGAATHDLTGLRRRSDALQARARAAQARYDALSQQVGEAKARVEASESVQAVLVEMQRRGHARSVGVFERLLTALLRDVFPEERDVHLDLYTDRGLPALDLYISKNDDEMEDTETGTGGGVVNGLSTGLRFISLMRSGRRPFIILDEPDCWMETQRVPAFARLIQQTATELGIQVLMVSHHPDHLLSAIPHRLKLEKGAQGLEINWAPSSEIPEWQPDQPGLRGVLFENCFGHTCTFLPLAPGVTLLRGSNDEGKSSLVAAMTMVVEGKTKDAMIRHHQPWARVTLDFGPDKTVRFQRKRTGSPKVCYELVDPTLGPKAEPLRRSTDSRSRPDWLLDVTGIGAVDDLNIQMANQKQPVFLLDQTATQRAKALAIGSESGYVQQMLAFDKQEIQEARLVIRQGEKELEHLHRELRALAPGLDDAGIARLEQGVQEQARRARRMVEMTTLAGHWAHQRSLGEALRPLAQRLVCALPPASPVNGWRHLWTGWFQSQQQIRALARLAERPHLTRLAPSAVPGWQRLLHAWQQHGHRRHAWDILDAGRPPAGAPLRSLDGRRLATQWTLTRTRLAALAPLATPAPQSPAVVTRVLQTLWSQWSRHTQHQALLEEALAGTLPTLPRLNEGAATRALERHWLACQHEAAQAQAAWRQLQEESDALEGEEAQVLDALQQADPHCPVCRQAWPHPSHEH